MKVLFRFGTPTATQGDNSPFSAAEFPADKAKCDNRKRWLKNAKPVVTSAPQRQELGYA